MTPTRHRLAAELRKVAANLKPGRASLYEALARANAGHLAVGVQA